MTGQDVFRRALLDPSQPVPEGLVDGAGRPAGRRFSVYRNNVAVSLTEALETGFPVIAKLLGEQNFRMVAGVFLRRFPPASPLMMHYGEAFPEFLAGFQPVAHLGYLADVARLELALRASYHAGDATPQSSAALESVPPERLADLRLGLAPSLRVQRSPWPVYDIWRFNTEDGAPKPRAVAQDVAILRPAFDPQPHALPAGGAACLLALIGGATLGQAVDAASVDAAEFDLAPVLGLLLKGQVLIHISTEDKP